MILFSILCGIDGLITAVVLFFFFWGLADGTISAFNIGIWMAMLAGVVALFGGGIALRTYGRRVLANTMLGVLAAPGLLVAFFFFLLIVLHPDWK
jgi:hypothetical protein